MLDDGGGVVCLVYSESSVRRARSLSLAERNFSHSVIFTESATCCPQSRIYTNRIFSESHETCVSIHAFGQNFSTNPLFSSCAMFPHESRAANKSLLLAITARLSVGVFPIFLCFLVYRSWSDYVLVFNSFFFSP